MRQAWNLSNWLSSNVCTVFDYECDISLWLRLNSLSIIMSLLNFQSSVLSHSWGLHMNFLQWTTTSMWLDSLPLHYDIRFEVLSHIHTESYFSFTNTQIQYLSFTLEVDGHWTGAQAKRAKFLLLLKSLSPKNNTKNIKMSAQFFSRRKNQFSVWEICLWYGSSHSRFGFNAKKMFSFFLRDVEKYTKLSPTNCLNPLWFHQYSNSNK